jgi:hypothetical protein
MNWRATIGYLKNNGPVDVDYFFDDINDFPDIIERGPHYQSIIKCTVVPVLSGRRLTVEAAAEL